MSSLSASNLSSGRLATWLTKSSSIPKTVIEVAGPTHAFVRVKKQPQPMADRDCSVKVICILRRFPGTCGNKVIQVM